MDNNSAQTSQAPVQQPIQLRVTPSRQPHIPISENETLHEPPQQNSSKNRFFILLSLLILAIVVGITLYLYIQNKTAKITTQKTEKQATQAIVQETTPKNYVPKTEEEKKMAENIKKYGVACKKFTSIDEALKTPEIACILDLSKNDINSLPDDITKLINLNTINLSNNNFNKFPTQLLSIPTLVIIDMSNNKLSQTPDISILTKLQSLILTGNPIKNKITPTQNPSNPLLKITY
jgi:cell division protein FtsI/penicillin-binding protein 2